MKIDPDSRAYLSRELTRLVNEQVSGLVTGDFPTVASLERQRGVIVGLGLALDLVEERPLTPTEKLSEGQHDEATD